MLSRLLKTVDRIFTVVWEVMEAAAAVVHLDNLTVTGRASFPAFETGCRALVSLRLIDSMYSADPIIQTLDQAHKHPRRTAPIFLDSLVTAAWAMALTIEVLRAGLLCRLWIRMSTAALWEIETTEV